MTNDGVLPLGLGTRSTGSPSSGPGPRCPASWAAARPRSRRTAWSARWRRWPRHWATASRSSTPAGPRPASRPPSSAAPSSGRRTASRSSGSPGPTSPARSSTASTSTSCGSWCSASATIGSSDWSARVRGTIVPDEDGVFELGARPGGAGPGAPRRRGRARRCREPTAARRHGDVRHGQPGPGGRGDARPRACRSRSSSSTPRSTRWPRTSGSASGRPTPPRSWTRRWPRRPTPTSPWCSSAPAATGRPRAGTGPASAFPAARTSWSAGSPRPTRGRWSWSTRRATVDLPWADDVAAVLQCWFGGQEMAPGVADVLVGDAEPGGRLPTTIPVRIEHSPSHDNFPGENGELRYGEGVFMGYRGYEHRAIEPRFAFGHGLSYTTFALRSADALVIDLPGGGPAHGVGADHQHRRPGRRRGGAAATWRRRLPGWPARRRSSRLSPRSGWRRGSRRRSSSCSTTAASPTGTRASPTGTRSRPGPERCSARPPRSAGSPGWQVDPGRYQLLIGRSSQDVAATLDVEILAD